MNAGLLSFEETESRKKAIFDRNRALLMLYFIFTTFHGVVRKWIIPNNDAVSSVLVSIQLFLPLIVAIFAQRGKPATTSLNFALFVYAFLLLGLALNPMNQTLVHGIFGFVVHFGFWLMMFTYLNHRDLFPVESMLPFIALVCLGQVLLGTVQFVLPTEHFLNRYDKAGDGIATMGAYVRVTGTFSYVTGFGCFIFLVGCFAWASLVEGRRNVVFIALLLGLGMLGAFMSGARAVVACFILFTLFGIWSAGFDKKMALISTTIVLFLVATLYLSDKQLRPITIAYDAFSNRTKELNRNGETSSRLINPLMEALDFRGDYPLLGVGLGATYQGAIAKFGASSYVKQYGFFEEDGERVVLEGGYLLFFFRIFLFVLLIKNLMIPKPQMAVLAFFLIFFVPLIFNVYQTCYTFLGLACVDKMYYLREQARLKMALG